MYKRVREKTSQQTPSKWESDVSGTLIVAENPLPLEAPLPDDLQAAIDSFVPEAREKAIPRLEKLLLGSHRGLALSARNALVALANDDSRRVSGAARKSLAANAGEIEDGKTQADQVTKVPEPAAPVVERIAPQQVLAKAETRSVPVNPPVDAPGAGKVEPDAASRQATVISAELVEEERVPEFRLLGGEDQESSKTQMDGLLLSALNSISRVNWRRLGPILAGATGVGLAIMLWLWPATPAAIARWFTTQSTSGQQSLGSPTAPTSPNGTSTPQTQQTSLSAPAPCNEGVARSSIAAADPAYPSAAFAAGISGTVVVRILRSAAGAIESENVVSGPAALQQAALDWVRTQPYAVCLVNGDHGQTRATEATWIVNFTLGATPAQQQPQKVTNVAVNQQVQTAAQSLPPVQAQQSGPLKIVAISAGVATGLLLSKTDPVYPPIAKAARVSGTVVLHVVISTAGSVESENVISGPAMLQQAALDAVKTWRYRPYLLNNQPVQVQATVNVIFTLD